MQVHILSLYTPSTPGMGSKVITFFLKVVMLHIKLNGMEHKTLCKYRVFLTHSIDPLVESKSEPFFLKVVMVNMK